MSHNVTDEDLNTTTADQSTLKQRCGAAKAVITRLSTQVNQALNAGQHRDLETTLSRLDEAVSKFVTVHGQYHKTLQDDDDIDASEGYRTAVLREVHDLRHVALSWLEGADLGPTEADDSNADQLSNSADQGEEQATSVGDTPPSLADQLDQLRVQLKELQVRQMDNQETPQPRVVMNREDFGPDPPSSVAEPMMRELLELSRRQYQLHMDSMRLPPADIVKFDGEPLKYWRFMRLFSTVVDKETVPAVEKLTRLLQYTVDRARSAIAHCLYNPDPEVGYDEALTILRRRFGNPYTIAQAWIDKVLNFKDIKDNKQLQSFADILRGCRDTLRSMKCEGELNSGRTLLKIVEKLPDDMKRRWLTRNYEITESGRLPILDDVLHLVEVEVAKGSDPIFGNLLRRGASTGASQSKHNNDYNNYNDKHRKKQSQSFAVESSSRSPKSAASAKSKETSSIRCPRCNNEHFLNQCSAFRQMSVPDRLTFV